MRTTAAQTIVDVMGQVLGVDLGITVQAWDGSVAGPPGGPTIVLNNRRALRRIAYRPDEIGLARAYVSGDLDLRGDVYAALTQLAVLAERPSSGVALSARDRLSLLAAALRLGAVGREPEPPDEEARLTGQRHTRRRDTAAVRHHYDVGNTFYERVLGPSMVYSCGFWRDATTTLEEAQRDKLELVARKLDLQPGQRILDVGCGWGSFLIHAATEHGVSGVGITLSQEQAVYARERIAAAGLSDRLEVRVAHYEELGDESFDAIASIGMAEHVGSGRYLEYAQRLRGLLRDGGRLLNHQIARRPGEVHDEQTFINSYVFPDGELLPLAVTVGALEEAGFEVRDVEGLREHYALTLRAWVANLDRCWDACVAEAGEGRSRIWRLYMAASALAFEANRLGVNQVLAVRTSRDGRSGMPRTRESLLLDSERDDAAAAA